MSSAQPRSGDSLEAEPSKKLFQCSSCGLEEKYNYYGKNPPFAKQIRFSDDCYVIKDPFAPSEEGLFLLLGSNCSLCQKAVCQSQDCSVYYGKWFCMPCCKVNLLHFPKEVQKEISGRISKATQ